MSIKILFIKNAIYLYRLTSFCIKFKEPLSSLIGCLTPFSDIFTKLL